MQFVAKGVGASYSFCFKWLIVTALSLDVRYRNIITTFA